MDSESQNEESAAQITPKEEIEVVDCEESLERHIFCDACFIRKTEGREISSIASFQADSGSDEKSHSLEISHRGGSNLSSNSNSSTIRTDGTSSGDGEVTICQSCGCSRTSSDKRAWIAPPSRDTASKSTVTTRTSGSEETGHTSTVDDSMERQMAFGDLRSFFTDFGSSKESSGTISDTKHIIADLNARERLSRSSSKKKRSNQR